MNVLPKYLISFLLLTSIFKGFTQTASFTVDKSSGCDSLKVVFTNTSIVPAGQTATYLWEFDTLGVWQSATPPIQKFYTPKIYHIKLTMTIKNKPYVASQTISVRPDPNPYFTVADTFQLKTDNNFPYIFRSGKVPTDTISYRYRWELNVADTVIHAPAKGIIRDTLIRKFSTEGPYTMHLKVTDNAGCVDSFSRSFFVSQKLNIPNVFTPDGNGRYDFFQVETNGRITYSLKIYTSAGQLIFKSLSKSIIWDGNNFDGSPAIPGTYYYIIQAENEPIKKENCGFLMLLKNK